MDGQTHKDVKRHNRVFRDPKSKKTKTALVLAGGGLTGCMYEVGALCAIDEMLVGHNVLDFDIYVGTSAGSLVAAMIANGFSAQEAMEIIQDRHPDIDSFGVGDIFYANYDGLLRRMAKIPMVLFNIGRELLYLREAAVSDIIWELGQLLPTGLYNGLSVERFLQRVLLENGYTNQFDRLQKELYIVATELDSGNRAVFGPNHTMGVPISQAVAASSAVPLLFRPFQIGNKDYVDGSLHGAASLDLAIEAGAELIVCINPLVPLDAERTHPGERYVRTHGLHTVANQTLRTLMHSTLRYHIKNLRAKYPQVDIILIQPQWDDQRMFAYNPMHYRSRHQVAEHGFASVISGFIHNIDYFRTILARHDIQITKTRTVRQMTLSEYESEHQAIAALPILPEPIATPVADLRTTLDKLEQTLQKVDELCLQASL
ncbi:MAG: patatin-like phospholipase family protein [Caldilineaceae bacterium]